MPGTPGANLGVPFGWLPHEPLWGALMNAGLRGLDTLVQAAIKDKDLTAPPGSPADGDRYIVGASATGAWSGHDAELTVYYGAAWIFFVPKEGWLAWANDEDKLYVYDGSAWVEFAGATGIGGGSKRVWMHCQVFSTESSSGMQQRGSTGQFEVLLMSGTVDKETDTAIVLPSDFSSVAAWKLFWVDAGASSGNVVWRLGTRVVADATTADAAYTTSDTTVAMPNSNQKLTVSTLTDPGSTLSAGDLVMVQIQRRANSDSGDTASGFAGIVGLLLEYS